MLELLTALLGFLLAAIFIVMFVPKIRNRGTFPGFHRHPENVRRKRNEEVEITQGWQI